MPMSRRTTTSTRVPGRLFASQPTDPSSAERQFEPFPGASFFQAGRKSPVIGGMHRRLVAEHCDRYTSHAGLDVWGAGDVRSYTAWQQKLGFVGNAADGVPGRTSWDRLEVPKV